MHLIQMDDLLLASNSLKGNSNNKSISSISIRILKFRKSSQNIQIHLWDTGNSQIQSVLLRKSSWTRKI